MRLIDSVRLRNQNLGACACRDDCVGCDVLPIRFPTLKIVQDDQVRQAVLSPIVHMRAISVPIPPASDLAGVVLLRLPEVIWSGLYLRAHDLQRVETARITSREEQIGPKIMTVVRGDSPFDPLKCSGYLARTNVALLYRIARSHVTPDYPSVRRFARCIE